MTGSTKNQTLSTNKKFDLEDRARGFALHIRALIKKLPRTAGNRVDSLQLLRSSGSVGANYIEANEALGAKDFAMRIRIARKEAKESRHWLLLLDHGGALALEREIAGLVQEAHEFVLILSAILKKYET